jgi:hypothetical protein
MRWFQAALPPARPHPSSTAATWSRARHVTSQTDVINAYPISSIHRIGRGAMLDAAEAGQVTSTILWQSRAQKRRFRTGAPSAANTPNSSATAEARQTPGRSKDSNTACPSPTAGSMSSRVVKPGAAPGRRRPAPTARWWKPPPGCTMSRKGEPNHGAAGAREAARTLLSTPTFPPPRSPAVAQAIARARRPASARPPRRPWSRWRAAVLWDADKLSKLGVQALAYSLSMSFMRGLTLPQRRSKIMYEFTHSVLASHGRASMNTEPAAALIAQAALSRAMLATCWMLWQREQEFNENRTRNEVSPDYSGLPEEQGRQRRHRDAAARRRLYRVTDTRARRRRAAAPT